MKTSILPINRFRSQGHPIDLFIKMSVLLAICCWLRDVEVMICPRKESVVGKKTIQGV